MLAKWVNEKQQYLSTWLHQTIFIRGLGCRTSKQGTNARIRDISPLAWIQWACQKKAHVITNFSHQFFAGGRFPWIGEASSSIQASTSGFTDAEHWCNLFAQSRRHWLFAINHSSWQSDTDGKYRRCIWTGMGSCTGARVVWKFP